MDKIQATFIFFFLLIGNIDAQNLDYNVKVQVKKSGKTQMITQELQALIDKCNADGGGEIYFPAGEYLSGTLTLKNNIYLNLSAGATLNGSMDLNDYPNPAKDGKSLIYANGATNIGIIGNGTINGQGDAFWRGKKKPYSRPDRLILLENCKEIRIKDVKLTNSPNWTLEPRLCTNVWIDGISIINERKSPNSDGIDPVSCKNVFIANCYIETGDDAICPKSIGNVATENLVVSNCVLISDDAAIKLGTRSEAGIKEASFNNIFIKNTRYGIAFYAKDGGTFENIKFNNIHIQTSTNNDAEDSKASGSYPIYMDVEKRDESSALGKIKNVFFSDITIDSQDGHCVFLGQPESKISNINFNNISFNLQQRRSFAGLTKPRGVANLTNKASNDFSSIPAHFIFAYVDGVKITDFEINDNSKSQENEKHLFWFYESSAINFNNLKNTQNILNNKLALINFNNVSSIEIKSSTPKSGIAPFIYLEGLKTKDVVSQNNNFLGIKSIYKIDNKIENKNLVFYNNLENK
jgi:hypothetical protein